MKFKHCIDKCQYRPAASTCALDFTLDFISRRVKTLLLNFQMLLENARASEIFSFLEVLLENPVLELYVITVKSTTIALGKRFVDVVFPVMIFYFQKYTL